MALLQVDFFSEVLGMCTQMSVILPQRTSRQIGMTGTVREGKYPAVFLLHGMTDDHTHGAGEPPLNATSVNWGSQ